MSALRVTQVRFVARYRRPGAASEVIRSADAALSLLESDTLKEVFKIPILRELHRRSSAQTGATR